MATDVAAWDGGEGARGQVRRASWDELGGVPSFPLLLYLCIKVGRAGSGRRGAGLGWAG